MFIQKENFIAFKGLTFKKPELEWESFCFHPKETIKVISYFMIKLWSGIIPFVEFWSRRQWFILKANFLSVLLYLFQGLERICNGSYYVQLLWASVINVTAIFVFQATSNRCFWQIRFSPNLQHSQQQACYKVPLSQMFLWEQHLWHAFAHSQSSWVKMRYTNHHKTLCFKKLKHLKAILLKSKCFDQWQSCIQWHVMSFYWIGLV